MGKGARIRAQRAEDRKNAQEALKDRKVRKEIDREIGKQSAELHNWFYENELYCMLYTLHNTFGFGATRLRRFCEAYAGQWRALRDYYEGGDIDAPYFAKQALLSAGIDADDWIEKAAPGAGEASEAAVRGVSRSRQ